MLFRSFLTIVAAAAATAGASAATASAAATAGPPPRRRRLQKLKKGLDGGGLKNRPRNRIKVRKKERHRNAVTVKSVVKPGAVAENTAPEAAWEAVLGAVLSPCTDASPHPMAEGVAGTVTIMRPGSYGIVLPRYR